MLIIIIYMWTYSYQILNPKGIKGLDCPKKCTKILIESTELNDDQYRLGNTKARTTNHIFCPWNTSKTPFVYGSETDVQTLIYTLHFENRKH